MHHTHRWMDGRIKKNSSKNRAVLHTNPIINTRLIFFPHNFKLQFEIYIFRIILYFLSHYAYVWFGKKCFRSEFTVKTDKFLISMRWGQRLWKFWRLTFLVFNVFFFRFQSAVFSYMDTCCLWMVIFGWLTDRHRLTDWL
jgi:hypothetical protein